MAPPPQQKQQLPANTIPNGICCEFLQEQLLLLLPIFLQWFSTQKGVRCTTTAAAGRAPRNTRANEHSDWLAIERRAAGQEHAPTGDGVYPSISQILA